MANKGRGVAPGGGGVASRGRGVAPPAKPLRKPDIVQAMKSPLLFAPWFKGPSWANWHAVLKAAFALPMTEAERAFFRTVADREPPAKPARELWFIVGRGGGKDSIASDAGRLICTGLLRR